MSHAHDDDLRMLLGGYLLGGLDPADTDRMDAHLSTCADCRVELERLSPVPELLRDGAPIEDVGPPAPGLVEDLLGRMRAERAARAARQRRLTWAAAAAAVLVAAVAFGAGALRPGGGGPGPVAQPSPVVSQPAPEPSGVVARFAGAAGTRVAGVATLSSRTWGVSIALDMSGLEGEAPFVLRVSGPGGATEQACVWGSTPSGNARVTGASSLQLPAVDSVEVADRTGRVLATATL
ncbi:zf-HC2 domain-containing protein [Spirilliplanes yamanashiensis]|uniref:Putative zinc-finger domain-containing protein n=1 Tax=Spirilliplanes yamanashiensis TaxID=42233 RepID=A0A8J4DK33_9ACTN|nr:zf-HC2 domain-containing protein [Spirilliplanes yamanashiensis]MDP9815675.1 hypothetical protein [Spirilliplanes yamanashiensis]GIJ03929.1 hypothetical protein Sya03_32810 [Spirilliplanes yamanashiensis]